MDAEGHFFINLEKNSWNFLFKIELHKDDTHILKKIAQTLGIGTVTTEVKNRNSAYFSVTNFQEIVTVLIPIFQKFPLQTSKYFDFMCFYEAALLKVALINKNRKLKSKTDVIVRLLLVTEAEMNKIRKLKTSMNSKRLSLNIKEEDYLSKNISINK